MDAPVHASKGSKLEDEITCELTGDALIWKKGEAQGRMPLGEVARIHLGVYPFQRGRELGQCTLRDGKGDKLKFYSYEIESLTKYDDRRDTYGPFVRALCARVAAANPQARFVAGSTMVRTMVILMVVLAVAAFAVLYFGFVNLRDYSYVFLGIFAGIAVVLPRFWSAMRRASTRRFDPANPPEALLRPAWPREPGSKDAALGGS